MKVTKLSEYGYEESVLGFSLSYNTSIERAKQILPKYAFGVPGENKFLESIYLWLDVTAPRFWWQEADTYRLSTKQSESTMHTLKRRELVQSDFEDLLPEEMIEAYNSYRDWLFKYNATEDTKLMLLKNMLPEGFLQRRIWVMNYKCLQNIYIQRINHRLPQWKYFLTEVLKQIEHPEFIVKEN